jgi:hypothetical protein
MMITERDEIREMAKSMNEIDQAIWQLINREIDAGRTFSNSFLEDIASSTVPLKFYALKYGQK